MLGKIFVIILVLLQIPLSFAQKVNGNEIEEILTSSIFEELIKITKDLTPPEDLIPKNKSINKMSRGKRLIEEMKRKNREKLARMRGVNPDEVKSGKDIVKKQKQQNKELISTIHKEIKSLEQWKTLADSEITELRKRIISDWKKKHELKLKEWDKKKKLFNLKKNQYGNTTFDLPLILPPEKIKKEKPVVKIDREYLLVPNVLSIPIRDQKYRPTCSSFSGVRAIESELFKRNKFWDLSEQYFYWASKKQCRYKKCSKKGSWVGHGLEFSKKEAIPFEYDCKYNPVGVQGNETQIPLKRTCEKGKVKISNFDYFHSMDEVIAQIENGHVVIASMKLTPNYYSSSSLILNKDKWVGKKMDSHSRGHSMTIVGYVKLPKILEEGRVCFIVANSWGTGWGKGGHSCISEKWMTEQKQVNPFVAVTSISF